MPMKVEAAVAVGAYVRRERDRLVSREPLVRRDRPGAVKAMRSASRRLRSVWHTLGECEGADGGNSGLFAECTWLGEHLGVVRHLDETAHRVLRHPAMAGPPARWAIARLARERDPARQVLLGVLDGVRYASLVAALDAKADDPVPQSAAAGLGARFCAAWPPLLGELAAAAATADAEARADALHEVRRAAKPLLDTGRSVARAHPELLRRPLRRLTALHDLLGEHQDSTVCRRTLEPWSSTAPDRDVREALRGLTEDEWATTAAAEARLPALHEELTALRPGR
ncbi:CHAD domain-containing protein [Streptomyces sp. NPDC057686]|uniref:CHAD domain-containing protein n=1 Tax=Streptomyces sp. NPDC057686 TaxID=3346212 RepID=UPI0036C4F4A9